MTISPDLHVGLPFLEGLCNDLRGKPSRVRRRVPKRPAITQSEPASYLMQTIATSLTIASGVASALFAMVEIRSSL
ncbi:hypothetical protein KOR42_09380 [Thalassoglobus neptunius]|uniref:Uncharacterized protein n=1 Tax=Thalassoglobus neptunius TaxID=1938619 RepID=A0A5C5X3P7_9PLAN|nr:hypothetical protein [Thalassoglobus neptunius]TWT57576.1 hypothetical protein KOR42_09380 [Thalassoglobus neptunius]